MSIIRREEIKRIAEELRVLHNVTGGIFVMFLEPDECPYAFAVPVEVGEVIRTILPPRLREAADAIDGGSVVAVETEPGHKLS